MPPKSPATSLRPRRRYHHGNLRTALIEAGLQLIEEKGVRALTLREIAARVGVSRMAPYRHFPTKEHLLAAISEAGFEQFRETLEGARQSVSPDFRARLAAMGLAYVRFATEHRAHFEVMFSAIDTGTDRKISVAGQRAFAVLEETIREAQSRGEVRSGDSVLLAELAWSTIHGISVLGLGTDSLTPGRTTDLVETCSEVLRTGFEPRPVCAGK